MGAEKQNIECGCHESLRCFRLIVRVGVSLQNVAAEFGSATATIARQEFDQPAKFAEIGAVVHHSALPLNLHKPCAAQHREMRRHGVVRHLAHARDVAGVESVWMNLQEVAKNGEPGGLAKRAKPAPRLQIRL